MKKHKKKNTHTKKKKNQPRNKSGEALKLSHATVLQDGEVVQGHGRRRAAAMVRVRHQALVQPPVLPVQSVLVFIELLTRYKKNVPPLLLSPNYVKGGSCGGRDPG